MLDPRVTGIDLAERLLAVARSKSLAKSLHNVDFQRADTTALGYPDASFDAGDRIGRELLYCQPRMPASQART